MSPSLSVVIPCYNDGDVVERAIRSVLDAAEPDVELIVVDDGSTDSTADVLTQILDPRLRVLARENGGVCMARNTGLAAATAPFVVFLDSDDEATAGWVRFFLAAARDGVQLASCGVAMRGDRNDVVIPPRPSPAFGNVRVRYLAGAFGIESAILREVGGFREGLRFSEHTDLGLRLGGRFLAEPVVTRITNEPLVVINRSEPTYDPQIRYDSAMVILREDAVHLSRSRHLNATYAAIAGVAASKLGRRGEASRLLVEAIRSNPRSPRNYLRLGRALVQRDRTGGIRGSRPGT